MLRDSDADALVTGDKALLALGGYVGKPILTPGDFMSLLRQADGGADGDT